MKKFGMLLLIGIAVWAFTGCSMPMRSNTLRSKEFSPSAFVTPTLAELDVADKKVMGQAKGHRNEKARLEKSAITDALKADADVLVGVNFFYEIKGDVMTVIVIGYPAKYKNFKPARNSGAANKKAGNFVIETSDSKKTGSFVMETLNTTSKTGDKQ